MRTFLSALVVVFVLLGCASRGHELLDTLGTRFPTTGETPDDYAIASGASAPSALVCDGTTAASGHWVFRGAHLITICPTADENTMGIDCRPLACGTGDDCPPTSDFEPIACERGLCVRSTETWNEEDVVTFCVQNVARPTECASRLTYLNACSAAVGDAIRRQCASSPDACTTPIVCGM